MLQTEFIHRVLFFQLVSLEEQESGFNVVHLFLREVCSI
jgi:hypothetical protein